MSHDVISATAAETRRLPMVALLALATATFITSLTETLPAGVLPAMSKDLAVSESAMGQAVTIYALGTALTAIPLTIATARVRRRPLLLVAMVGFAAANSITAFSDSYALTMVGRAAAGVAAGVAWAMLAGYAMRMVPKPLQGKAIAVVMTGIPLALSLGVPAGTYIGKVLDWRVTFALMSVLALLTVGWIAARVPDFPGVSADGRTPLRIALAVRGVRPVLTVTLIFVLAHTVLYAYISTFLERVGLGESADLVLLVFGVACLISIWATGVLVEHQLRTLTVASIVLILVAGLVLAQLADEAAMTYAAAALWGLGWGGVPTLLQTAAGRAGAAHSQGAADTAQAGLVTLWNAAMAGGAVLGGLLLDARGTSALPWAVVILLVPTLLIVLLARRHGFPGTRHTT